MSTAQWEVPSNSDIDTSERLEIQKGTHLASIDPFCGSQRREVQRFQESEHWWQFLGTLTQTLLMCVFFSPGIDPIAVAEANQT
jgi:hypothetical protein